MTKKPLWITFAFNLNLSWNQAERWSEGVLSCQHQHALVSATTTYRSRQRKIKETSEIYQPAISDYQPPPVPLLPASIHPSSLLFISVSMWHQLYPPFASFSLLTQSWITPIKVRFVSLPPSVSLSPSLLIFLPSTHNEWLKNVHCVVSACVFVRADTVSEATFNPERERERRNGRLMSRWWQKYESLKAEGGDEWLQLLTPPKVTAREPKRTKGFELRNRKRDAIRRCD